MKWYVEFGVKAAKAFEKLDKKVQQRIAKEIDRLSSLENPQLCAKSLKGNFSGLCRFRVGDYRIICQIEDEILKILVIGIAYRREVYK